MNDKSKRSIALFAFNNAATNCYMILLNIASYYTFGPAGLLMSVLLNIITVMRILDGITDPFIGTLIDKTKTRFGKYRPFIIIGQIIMLLSVLLLYTVVNKIENKILAYIVFIIFYAFYVIGYTCQTTSTKAGQTIISKSPKVRPLMTLFDTIYTTIIFTSFGVILPILASEYGSLSNQKVFNMMMLIYMPLSLIFTILAVIGIKDYDNDKYLINNKEKIKLSYFIEVLKHNKPLKCLITSEALLKLAQTISTHTLITTLLFGVILNNYNLSSYMSILVSLITIILIFIVTKISKTYGQKRSFVYSSLFSALANIIYLIIIIIINTKGTYLNALSFKGILFSICFIITRSSITITQGITIPMIADCADYETYKYNKTIPGVISTLFSFVDKVISSLSTSLISIMLLFTLGSSSLDINTPYSNGLFIVFIIAGIIIPLISFIINIIMMKYYSLDKNKMEEISSDLENKIKNN